MSINSKKRVFILLVLIIFTIPKGLTQTNDKFKLATDFLEKYKKLLQATPTDSISNLLRQTKESGFKFLEGNERVFRSLNEFTEYTINFSEEIYTVSWGVDGKTVLKCQFPANYGMMTFSNKIDIEKSMASRLTKIAQNPIGESKISVVKDIMTPVEYSDLYVMDRGFYITPRLRNLTVFTENPEASDSCCLLMESGGRYLLESIQNMMLTGRWNYPVNINLNLSEYGYKNSHFTKPLLGVYEMLEEEGSIPYWGLEAFDGKTVKGILIWRNEYGGFNHVLPIEFPVEILKEGGNINATMFCYVRTDNLKSLFEEFM